MIARPALCLALLAPLAAPAVGREPVKFADDPALSPDGSTLAFAWRGDLWTVPTAGGTATRLTAHPADDARPKFSPDGSAIAFDSNRTGPRHLYTVPAAGGAPRRVSGHAEGYTLQGWFPDGGALLAVGARDHHWRGSNRFLKVTIPAENVEPGSLDAAPEELLFDAYGTDGSLSPDGSKLLYVREGERWWRKGYVGPQAAQIWLWDAADGSHSEVLRPPGGARSPIWKADGAAFHYVGRGVDDAGNAAGPAFNLRSFDFFKRSGAALTSFPDDSVLNPTVAGNVAVFRRLFDLYRLDLADPEAAPEKIEIRLAADDAPDPLERRQLTGAASATVSPDGLEWAFAAGGDIWAMDTVLREPVLVTRDGGLGTAAWDTEPVFVGGTDKTGPAKLLFLSETDGQVDLYSAVRADPAKPWWRQSDFTIERLTETPATERNLTVAPGGARIGFVREPGELVVARPDGTGETVLHSGFDAPDYTWGPEGHWIAAAWQDDEFNSEVYLLPADGSRPPVNVSRHPDNDGGPAFSPDGEKLAFAGRRDGDERDVHWLYLRAGRDDETTRDRKLAEALEKFEKRDAGDRGEEIAEVAPEDRAPLTAPKPFPRIDFENIHERVRTVSVPNSYEGGLFWLDDDVLAFGLYSADGRGTYAVDLPAEPGERSEPKKLTGGTGSFVRRLGGGKAAWVDSGTPGTLDAKGKTEEFRFSAKQQLATAGRMRTGFGAAWRLMRDNWYDPAFNNRDWDGVREKYLPVAAAAAGPDQLGEVVSMMLGELNGSHLGFYPSGRDRYDAPGAWSERTGHLGLRFERGYEGPGWKIRDVLPGGPADTEAADLEPGDVLLTIDGVDLAPSVGPAAVLTGDPDRDVTLTVQEQSDREAGGEPHALVLRPTSYGAARAMLYEHWLRQNRETVEALSDGRFGYLHIRSMNGSSLVEYERQLYNVGFGRDGLIIDVRDNGGGSTADRLLTSLTQPLHAITVPRGGGPGYPQDRKVYASWHKPVVVLCNQNSYSNAEIFSHAIKTLGRGKLVGVRTAGGVISTGSAGVTDVGRIRQPFRGWYVAATGEDMELNGAVPHVELWPAPGAIPAGDDVQLETAVEVLAEEVKAADAAPAPPLFKATDRPGRPRYDGAE